MNPKDVIEAYVADVAAQLPRRLRQDVAFELRALLSEELQAKAEAHGRNADVEMAIALLRAFGRPAEVAARYRPTVTIIDPADGYRFLQASLVGLVVIWSLGLLVSLHRPLESGWDVLGLLGQWWGSTVIPSLWWLGLLVTGFGLVAWARRRWPETGEWKPRTGERIHANRAAMVIGLVGIVLGVFVLADPRAFLDLVFGDRGAPAAYEAFTYTDAFRQRQGLLLLVLLVLNIPLLIAAIMLGRWGPTLQRTGAALSLATCATMAWAVLDGPVLMTSASDTIVKLLMGLIIAVTLINLGVKLFRSVSSTPEEPEFSGRTRAGGG